MSVVAKIRFSLRISSVMDEAMSSGDITGMEIVEALEIAIAAAKHANRRILESPPVSEESSIRLVFGEPKGQA